MNELDFVFHDLVYYENIKKQRDLTIMNILRTKYSQIQITYLMNIRKLYHQFINMIDNDDIVYRIYSYFGTDLVVINNRPITKEEMLNIGFYMIHLLIKSNRTNKSSPLNSSIFP